MKRRRATPTKHDPRETKLRSEIIRLAKSKPELRQKLLPLLSRNSTNKRFEPLLVKMAIALSKIYEGEREIRRMSGAMERGVRGAPLAEDGLNELVDSLDELSRIAKDINESIDLLKSWSETGSITAPVRW